MLLNHFNTGWVTFDDVLLTRVGQETVIKRSVYGIAGQTIATRVSGDPVHMNNGIFYFFNDHLGSTASIGTSNSTLVAGSRAYYLPFGGYRGPAPTQTVTDRDFTGQRENMELGLLYYGARFYVPGLGRFASADSIIPNPANPQSYNRYAYTRNNPLRFTDPTGHRECDLATGDCNVGGPYKPPPGPPKLSSKITPQPILEGLPIQNATWFNGFGANSFAARFADPDSPEYDGVYSSDSAGIHPGMDFGKAYDPNCAECMVIFSNVTGVVKVGIFDGDADPNVVIEVDLGNGAKIYVIYGHVHRTVVDGTKVHPGDPIGTLQDQREWKEDGSLKRDNTHVHLALRQGQRIINPAYFWKDPSEINGRGWNYPRWENLYSISSYEYTPGRSYWKNPGSMFGMTRY